MVIWGMNDIEANYVVWSKLRSVVGSRFGGLVVQTTLELFSVFSQPNKQMEVKGSTVDGKANLLAPGNETITFVGIQLEHVLQQQSERYVPEVPLPLVLGQRCNPKGRPIPKGISVLPRKRSAGKYRETRVSTQWALAHSQLTIESTALPHRTNLSYGKQPVQGRLLPLRGSMDHQPLSPGYGYGQTNPAREGRTSHFIWTENRVP